LARIIESAIVNCHLAPALLKRLLKRSEGPLMPMLKGTAIYEKCQNLHFFVKHFVPYLKTLASTQQTMRKIDEILCRILDELTGAMSTSAAYRDEL
jgi:hypothetical protein